MRMYRALSGLAVAVTTVLCAAGAAHGSAAHGTAMGAGPAGESGSAPRSAGEFSVLQMNLCRSGVAGCFNHGGDNPLGPATDKIIQTNPAVVTVNEACSTETETMAEDIERRTGRSYDVSWQPVGKREGGQTDPYPCTNDRGEYGIAVLAKQGDGGVGEKQGQRGGYYDTQDGGAEQRAYLCADFATVNACTTHLSTKDAVEAQCAQLKRILAGYVTDNDTVFGGDLNLRYPAQGDDPSAQECVPANSFRKGDGGVQHIIASNGFDFAGSDKSGIPGTDHPAWQVGLTR